MSKTLPNSKSGGRYIQTKAMRAAMDESNAPKSFLPDRLPMEAIDHETALGAVLEYNYSLACHALAKFRLVNRALRWMRVAIPLWMLLLLVIALRG